MKNEPDFLVGPFTIVVDDRERAPFRFDDITADASRGGLPLIIRREPKRLETGDYSILGLEHAIAVERKSLDDLFGTLGGGRDRFIRELDRMSKMQSAHVVIEADWRRIFERPPFSSKLKPKTISRSIIAWTQQFDNVHWWPMPNRRAAEVVTFRILDRFWNKTAER